MKISLSITINNTQLIKMKDEILQHINSINGIIKKIKPNDSISGRELLDLENHLEHIRQITLTGKKYYKQINNKSESISMFWEQFT